MNYSPLTVASHSASLPGTIPKSQKTQNRPQTISFLRNCKNLNEIRTIHAKTIKNNQAQDPFVVFDLLRACSNFNATDYAVKIFLYTEKPNVYIYTALIDGFVFSRFYFDGVSLYCQMVHNCILPDEYAFSSVLKACGFGHVLTVGRQVHCQVLKFGLGSDRLMMLRLMEFYGKCVEFNDALKLFAGISEDVIAATVMINSYMDAGLVDEAGFVFDRVRRSGDAVCWTAMIDGLVRNGEFNKGLEMFREMQRQNVRPNEVTVVCVLAACSQLGALKLGKWVHSYIGKHGIRINLFVGGALISMYARCGDIDEAQCVWDDMKEKDITTYNSMIAGLAMHGRSLEAVDVYRRLVELKLRPNSITFVGVLNACSHGGLLELGYEIFRSMEGDFGIEPQVEHYGCMVDLLGRVGRLEEAYDLIQRMNLAPDHIMLGSLLSACNIHGDVELGERVAKSLVNCGKADSGTYVLLSNVYASSGKWKEAAELRIRMKETGLQKEPGCSLTEVNNEIHEFFLGDIRHPDREDIYRKLVEMDQLLRLHGYTPATGIVSQDIDDQEKEMALSIHSERLAICYGLISTQPHTTLRIVNNLRVCSDCHTVIKLITKITKRKIILRDRNRFHHFENGVCSCKDYW